MPRINFEDSAWRDPRFIELCIRIGNRFKAIGTMVTAWSLAQEYWLPDKQLIPEEKWLHAGLGSELMDVGLAERREGGIYVAGTADQCAWWLEGIEQRREAGRTGGRISAQRNRDEKGRLLPRSAPPQKVQAPPSARLDRLGKNPSASKPSSSFSEEEEEKTKDKESIGQGSKEPVPQGQELIPIESTKQVNISKGEVQRLADRKKAQAFAAVYVRAYQSRFPGGRPEDLNDAKTRGQMLQWVRGYPLERACALIQVYFQMETKWFGTKGYDFITFKNNLNKIGQALDSGKDPDGNSINWSNVFGEGTAKGEGAGRDGTG